MHRLPVFLALFSVLSTMGCANTKKDDADGGMDAQLAVDASGSDAGFEDAQTGDAGLGDGGATVIVQACDVEAQTGCPDETVCDYESFRPGAELGTVCRSVTPAGTKGTACTADTDCAEGFGCRRNTPSSLGACVPRCESNSDCVVWGFRNCSVSIGNNYRICEEACDLATAEGCPDGWQCLFLAGAEPTQSGRICVPECPFCDRQCETAEDCSGEPCSDAYATHRHGANVCSQACDPVSGSGCGSEKGCAVSESRFLCVLTGNKQVGEPCDYNNRCGAGLRCIEEVCRQQCRVGEADCAQGSCTSFATKQEVKGVEYGVCL